MALYLLRRSAFLVVSLLLAMVVLFLLLRVLPGDPSNALLSVNATPEQIAAAQQQVGSDQPLAAAVRRAGSARSLTLEPRQSFITSLPVGPEIASRLAVTIPLTLIVVRARARAGARHRLRRRLEGRPWYGIALSAFSQLGIAVPVFWVGILLVSAFSIDLRWFPSGGFPRDDWADPAAALTSLALPVITIAIVMSASIARYVRSATLDVIGSDYLRNARALGSELRPGDAAARPPQRRRAGDLDPRHRAGDHLPRRGRRRERLHPAGARQHAAQGDRAARLPEHPGHPVRQHPRRAADRRLRRRRRPAARRPAAARTASRGTA